MLALILAGAVLAAAAVAIAGSRERPQRQPVRVEKDDKRTSRNR